MGKSDNVIRGKWSILFNNFLGGIAWSVGVWVGTAVIAVLVFRVITHVDFVPVVGDFVDQVIKYMDKSRETLPLP